MFLMGPQTLQSRHTNENASLHAIAHVYTPQLPTLPVFCSHSVRNGYIYRLPLSMTNKQTFRFGEQKETVQGFGNHKKANLSFLLHCTIRVSLFPLLTLLALKFAFKSQ